MGPLFPNKGACGIFPYSSSALGNHRPKVEKFQSLQGAGKQVIF